MRNIRDVLTEKELELEAVKRQVEALRLVVPLLSEESGGLNTPQPDQIVWKDATTGVPVKAWPQQG